jgi:signal transduction histidine kinase
MQWTAYLSEVREPLRKALALLAPHARKIEAATARNLEGLGFSEEELGALRGLRLGEQPAFEGRGLEKLRAELEREGQALARRGVPEEHARAAWFSRLESALPHLLRGREDVAPLVAALVRLAFAGGMFLSAGYDQARADSWRSFGERERQRLSRDLHDEIGHDLVVLKLYLEMIARDLNGGGDRVAAREKLEEAMGLVSQSLQSVRRLILDLGPAVLEEVGFTAAVRLYAKQFAAHTGLEVDVRERGIPSELPSTHETALYRVLQGALSNVIKHARARNVRIFLASPRRASLVMIVEDDGIGFDPAELRQAFGLAAMRERIESLGGRFGVESRPSGGRRRQHGTRIEIELPLPRHRRDDRQDQGPRLR